MIPNEYIIMFNNMVNRLNISSNDKTVFIKLLDVINKSLNDKPKKLIATNVETSNSKLLLWDNNETYEHEVRVRSTVLLPDNNPKINDLVIDRNNVYRKVLNLEKDSNIVVLSPPILIINKRINK